MLYAPNEKKGSLGQMLYASNDQKTIKIDLVIRNRRGVWKNRLL